MIIEPIDWATSLSKEITPNDMIAHLVNWAHHIQLAKENAPDNTPEENIESLDEALMFCKQATDIVANLRHKKIIGLIIEWQNLSLEEKLNIGK